MAVSGGDYGTTENFNVSVTVTDDDGAPTVSVGDAAAVAEGDDPETTTDMTFTVTLSAASGKVVTVPYTLAGSADADDDYDDPTTKSVTIAAGATTANIVIPVKGDELDEANETVVVTLGSPTNATVSTAEGAGTGTGTITDNDAAALSIADATAAEGATATFAVTLSTPSASSVTVTATTSEGTATDPEDYAHKAEALTFAAGETSKDFTVAIKRDSVAELDETFTVTLSGASGAAIADAAATGTISGAGALLAVADASAAEGDAMTFTVTRTGDTTKAASVRWTTGDDATEGAARATAGADYTARTTAQTLSFKAGDATATFAVATAEDAVDEPDETFAVTLASPSTGTDIADAAATGTITDDDAAPTVSVGDAAAVAEGNDTSATTDMTFTVTLSAASGKAVTVPYTLSGTAAADDDYTDPAIKSVTIAAGQTTADIVIAVKGDTLDEPNETITVTLGSPVNATVSTTQGAGAGTGTITDDDATPVATLVLTPATIDESGATNASTVTARLSGATSAALTLTVSAGTGVTLSTNKALTIAAGATASTGTVTLTAVNNALDAADLEVTVSATASGGNGVADPDDVTLTVTDDDAAPTVSVGDAAAVAEGDDPETTADMTFTVTLSAVSGKVVTVPYTLAGSADADDDYDDPTTKSVTIAAGATTANIVIPVKGDELDEANETVVVTLGGPTNATVSTAEGAGTGTGTITDDDTRGVTVTPTSKALTLAEADDSTTESVTENEASYTVVLMSEPTASVTVAITNPRNSPVALDKASLTFTTGNWDDAQTVTVTAADDDIDNAGDERTATLAHAVSGGGYGAAENFSVAVTVTDDDESGFAFDPTALTVTEGGADGSYTVALASQPTGAVTVTVTAPAGEQVTLDGPDADSAFSRSETVGFTTGNWSRAQTVTVRGGRGRRRGRRHGDAEPRGERRRLRRGDGQPGGDGDRRRHAGAGVRPGLADAGGGRQRQLRGGAGDKAVGGGDGDADRPCRADGGHGRGHRGQPEHPFVHDRQLGHRSASDGDGGR